MNKPIYILAYLVSHALAVTSLITVNVKWSYLTTEKYR